MKKEDFRNVTKRHILICKKIVRKEGDCYGLDCEKCPFCSNCNIFCDDDKIKSDAEEFLRIYGKPRKKKAVRNIYLKRDEGRKFYNFLKRTYKLQGEASNTLTSVKATENAIKEAIEKIVFQKATAALEVLKNE